MKKITEDELMLILDELISYCEGKDKKSMMNEYSLIKKDLEGKKYHLMSQKDFVDISVVIKLMQILRIMSI